MLDGWVKLHRKIVNWEWYTDGNTFRLFLHLLIKVSRKNFSYCGMKLKAGQLVTGRIKLAQELNLTEMQIRTSIKKLKSTNEITIKSTSQYSIITLNNWIDYQQSNQQDNQPITNEQPTDNQRITTKQEVREVKNTTTLYNEILEKFLNTNPEFGIYGEYKNVFLTTKQYNWIMARVLSKKKIEQYIEELSKNIASAKDKEFDFIHLEMHKIRVNDYFIYEKKNRKVSQQDKNTETVSVEETNYEELSRDYGKKY